MATFNLIASFRYLCIQLPQGTANMWVPNACFWRQVKPKLADCSWVSSPCQVNSKTWQHSVQQLLNTVELPPAEPLVSITPQTPFLGTSHSPIQCWFFCLCFGPQCSTCICLTRSATSICGSFQPFNLQWFCSAPWHWARGLWKLT